MRVMVEYKEQIRYLYMKFACEGVGDPAKVTKRGLSHPHETLVGAELLTTSACVHDSQAFKMSKAQFIDMCEKIKHTEGYSNEDKNKFKKTGAGLIFKRANEDLSGKYATESLPDELGEGELDGVDDEYSVEVDNTIEQVEFACALCRLAEDRYLKKLHHDYPKCNAMFPAMKLYMEEVVTSWFNIAKVADDEEKEFKTELMEEIAKPQLKKFAPKVKKLYAKIAASGVGPLP